MRCGDADERRAADLQGTDRVCDNVVIAGLAVPFFQRQKRLIDES
jgi:hypothetical protein